MSVTNYNPKADLGCRYNYNKLKNRVLLFSKEHVKNIHIDNGEAYVDDLTEEPLVLNGFNVQLSEESSLDERFKFSKTTRLSMHGYQNLSVLSERYYVILEDENGTYWIVNPDFPNYVTYSYTLDKDNNKTDFTFQCQSNFPTLKLNATFNPTAYPCNDYIVKGIGELKMLEVCYVGMDESGKTVYTYGKPLQIIEYLGNTLSLNESFNGSKVTTTIAFDISMSSYKSSWHYNLLEFMNNLYSAVITPKTGTDALLCGFNFGLEPSFAISASDEKGNSDTIRITLTEVSNHGIAYTDNYHEESRPNGSWEYVSYVNDRPAYECIELGVAKYLAKQEVNGKGCPTGNYQVLEGYDSKFPDLNITGHFSTTEAFDNPLCGEDGGGGSSCSLSTNIPSQISFSSQTCYTYSLTSTCDWSITNIPSYITVSPSTGSANSQYTVQVCNTKEVTSQERGSFNINYGDYIRVVDVLLSTADGFVSPSNVNINYYAQSVTFTFNPQCPITLVNADTGAVVNIGNGVMIVIVPSNKTAQTKIWHITVRDCNGNQQTVTVTQGTMEGEWVDVPGFICVGNDSYTKQAKVIINPDGSSTITDVYRAGTLIESGDSRCSSSQTRWAFNNKYYCISGTKYKALEEEISYDGGSTWTKTGSTKLGEAVEDLDDFCSQEATYQWIQTTKFQCGE